MAFQAVAGTEFELKADLVLLAMGFLGPRASGGRKLRSRADAARQRPRHNDRLSDEPRPRFRLRRHARGQSLVVWAIREGRECADAVDAFLQVEAKQPERPWCAELTFLDRIRRRVFHALHGEA